MVAKARPVRQAASAVKPRKAMRAQNRAKLSTTVAAENFTFLESLVSTGRTDSIARAVDLAIDHFRLEESRQRLERATAAYFDGLTPQAQAQEEALARQLHISAGGIDFDLEP